METCLHEEGGHSKGHLEYKRTASKVLATLSSQETLQWNKMLEISEWLYKFVDGKVTSKVFMKHVMTDMSGIFNEKLQQLKSYIDNNPHPYLVLIYQECNSLIDESNEIVSLSSYIDFCRQHYFQYVFDWYRNPISFMEYIDDWKNVSISIEADEAQKLLDLDEKRIMNKIFENIARILNADTDLGLLQELSMKDSDLSFAYYNRGEKAIYINKQIKGNLKLYVFIHELMHHIHFSLCDPDIGLSEFDYGAGRREGIVIYLTELIIKELFPELLGEHNKYLQQLKVRGLLAYKVFNEEMTQEEYIQELSKTGFSEQACLMQYCSTLKYPGYKESYYIFYDQMKKGGEGGLLQSIYKKNEY